MNELDGFYSVLRNRTTVAEYISRYEALFPLIHSNGLTANYRLAKGPFKRLRDEITPVFPFAQQHAALDDEIQFPLDDGPHDCNIWHRAQGRHRTIQITVVHGHARFRIMTELNAAGCSRGFLALNDDSGKQAFNDAMGREREMYSTARAQQVMLRAFSLCAEKKRRSTSDTLIIGASTQMLPRSRWQETQPALADLFAENTFSEVYVASDDDEFCWQLKPRPATLISPFNSA
jgi:hypothetical protein